MSDLERLSVVIKGVVAELRERAVREGHLSMWDEALQMIADEILSPNWGKDENVCANCGVGAGEHSFWCPCL